MKVVDQNPLKWAEGWQRTRIQDMKPRAGWKKPFRFYREAVTKELEKLGATEVVISYNLSPSDRTDPGVTVYFSGALEADYSWQEALKLNTPAPSLKEIDDAYRALSKTCHPDGPTPDVPAFVALGKHREQARAWVLGTHKHEHEYSIPCDRFNEVRLNLAAINLGLRALRQLEFVGIPGMLERTFRGFKTALPQHASKESHEQQTVA